MNAIYCDGGLIGPNPSPIGGTWAVRFVKEDVVIDCRSGIYTANNTDEFERTISNNFTEMLAVLEGMSRLPADWRGTVYSDSQITLGRVFMGWKWSHLPRWMRSSYDKIQKKLVNWDQLTFVLLQGHPTKAQLVIGHGDKYPVSIHNKWCDEECTRLANIVKEEIAKNKVTDLVCA